MRNFKRYIALTMAAVVGFAILLSACGGGDNNGSSPSQSASASGQETVELALWHKWGNGHEREVLEELIKQFESENPGIKITQTPVTDNTKFLSAISAGNPPDIIDLDATTVLGEWANKGILMPLDDLIAQDKIDKNAFIPAAWKAVTFEDKVYAMPFVAFNEGLLYNKKMFKEAGLDPDRPPETLEELVAYADKLTKVDADGNIQQMGFLPAWPISHLQTSLAWLFGGDFYDVEKKEITANDPAIAEALAWEREFYTKYTPQKVQNFITSSGQYLTAQDLFESGKLAMTIDGPWAIRFIQENVKDVDQNVGAAYIPYPEKHPENKGVSYIDVNPQIIPVGAQHPKEAWKFISWLTTNKDISSKFANLVANIPQLKDAPATELFKDDRFAKFIDLAASDSARVFPKIAVSSEYNLKLIDVENRALLSPKEDIQNLLDKLNEELNKSLKAQSK